MSCWMTQFEHTKETIEGFVRMFKCERCNKCEHTVRKVFVTMWDVARLARHLDISPDDFLAKYTFCEDGKCYMSSPCPFFDGEGCTVQDHKPQVCFEFPFNQPVKCKQRNGRELYMVTINTGCPAGKKLAEQLQGALVINPASVGVEV